MYYLLEANLYLAVFYGFYRLFLHKETFYNLNRYYLISTALLAFLLPLLQIGYISALFAGTVDQQINRSSNKPETQISTDLMLQYGMLMIQYTYFAVAVFLSMRLIKGLYGILSLTWTAPREKIGNIVQIELNDPEIAFSFFNYLFLNPQASEQQTIIKHELVHIEQKHSFDVMLFETLLILNWFNPAAWFVKKDIQLLHEYIADEQTTAQTLKKHEYAMFLIQNSFGHIPNPLSNQLFNQSILKKRINMLNKEKSAGRARLRLLLALPIAAAMVCSSSMALTKDYAAIDLYASKEKSAFSLVQDTLKKKTITKKATSPRAVRELPKGIKYPPPVVKPDVPVINNKTEPKVETVKFPPPIVTPVAPEKRKTTAKSPKVKFPPPVVKKMTVVNNEVVHELPPPPPVEPK